MNEKALSGFSIDWLHPNSLAAAFGIEEGDVVVEVNEIPVTVTGAIESGIESLIDNQYVDVTVVRGGQLVTIEYTVAD